MHHTDRLQTEITAQKDKQGRDGLDSMQKSFRYLHTISKYETSFDEMKLATYCPNWNVVIFFLVPYNYY